MGHLLAIDPAKSKPSWCTSFIDGKFRQFKKIVHKEIVSGNVVHLGKVWSTDPLIDIGDFKNIAIIESPYFNTAHSPKNQVSLILAVGEIGQFVRSQGYEVQYIPSWGNLGWIQSYFGQRTTREDALILSMQIAEADGIEAQNNDQAMAYCLGLWWLANNR